jgi:hypothetical protein
MLVYPFWFRLVRLRNKRTALPECKAGPLCILAIVTCKMVKQAPLQEWIGA